MDSEDFGPQNARGVYYTKKLNRSKYYGFWII